MQAFETLRVNCTVNGRTLPFSYRLTEETETAGPFQFGIHCLQSLDDTIDELFEHLREDGQEDLLDELCPYFGRIWPSARALSAELAELGPVLLSGKSAIELGCGLALPSFVLAKLGARVTASDSHPAVADFFERNLEANGRPEIRFLNWNWSATSAAPANTAPPRYDWVIGSDILYESHLPEKLARAIDSSLGLGGRALIADPGRPYLQKFSDEMKSRGFEGSIRTRKAKDDETPGGRDVFILEFRRNS